MIVIVIHIFAFVFVTKGSTSNIPRSEAGKEKEGIKETSRALTHRRPRAARPQSPGETCEEGARDPRGPRRPLSAGQRSAPRCEKEGDPEEGEAERGEEAGYRGKQNQNEEDPSPET